MFFLVWWCSAIALVIAVFGIYFGMLVENKNFPQICFLRLRGKFCRHQADESHVMPTAEDERGNLYVCGPVHQVCKKCGKPF